MLFQEDDMLDVIEGLAVEAGEIALQGFASLATTSVESKGHLDLVTEVDRSVEAFLRDGIRERFAEDAVFGEEGSAVEGSSGRTWVIDPIDGTFNFVRGSDQWAISIGLYQAGEPVCGVIHAPARGQTLRGGRSARPRLNGEEMTPPPKLDSARAAIAIGFHPAVPTSEKIEVLRFVTDDAKMNLRCCGSATISLLDLARGAVDGYLGLGESTWDVMAALPILEGLGIENTIDWKRTDLSSKLEFVCGSRDLLTVFEPLMKGRASAADTTAST